MADDKKAKPKKAKAKKAAPKKAAAKKPAKAKPKKAAGKTKKTSSASKSKAKVVGIDKSFAQLRDSLEHSVTLSRERIQEVVDDAVKRGRKQTDALVAELEKLVRQARRKLH